MNMCTMLVHIDDCLQTSTSTLGQTERVETMTGTYVQNWEVILYRGMLTSLDSCQ